MNKSTRSVFGTTAAVAVAIFGFCVFAVSSTSPAQQTSTSPAQQAKPATDTSGEPKGHNLPPEKLCHQMSESTIAAATGSQYEMVVLGDSVMWGQGLPEDSKASTLVQRWLQNRLNRPVHKRVYAHSGASILDNGDDTPIPAHEGEVGYGSPWITDQAACVPQPQSVDLVLVDGCINDLHPEPILDPTVEPPWIIAHAESKCRASMAGLLEAIATRFTRANVVVTGYFPIITDNSSSALMGSLIDHLFPGLEWVFSSYTKQTMINNSKSWADATDYLFADAVRRVNFAHHTSAGNRFAFARIPFGPDNGYGAPDRYLRLLPPILEKDPMFDQRAKQCDAVFGSRPRAIVCRESSAFHPNQRGAEVWAKAIEQQLDAILSQRPRLAVDLQPRAHIPVNSDVSFSLNVKDFDTQSVLIPTLTIDGQNVPLVNGTFRFNFGLRKEISTYPPTAGRSLFHRFMGVIAVPGHVSASFQFDLDYPKILVTASMPSTIGPHSSVLVTIVAKDTSGTPVDGQVLIGVEQPALELAGSTNHPFSWNFNFPRAMLKTCFQPHPKVHVHPPHPAEGVDDTESVDTDCSEALTQPMPIAWVIPSSPNYEDTRVDWGIER